ncbi:hypothetical protein ACS0TY_007934 [Phlomoides rotata]
MQGSLGMNLLQRQILTQSHRRQIVNRMMSRSPPCVDVFINHRGTDTKRSVASLLYHHFTNLQIYPFLDNKSMKPGDKLFEKIDTAIKRCKIGVAVFSPRYCESYFCLHELAMMMELRKKVIPIFCDVKPSELCINVKNVGGGILQSHDEFDRFNMAIQQAKSTVGLAFDSHKGLVTLD